MLGLGDSMTVRVPLMIPIITMIIAIITIIISTPTYLLHAGGPMMKDPTNSTNNINMQENGKGNCSIVVNIPKIMVTFPGVIYGLLVNSSNGQVVAEAYMNNNFQLVFSNVTPGMYELYVYYYPNSSNSLNLTEYWGDLTVNATPGKPNYYDFTRGTPSIISVQIKPVSNGKVYLMIIINNPLPYLINGSLVIYISSNPQQQSITEEIKKEIKIQPGLNNCSIEIMPSSRPTFVYVVLRANMQNYQNIDVTGQWNWTQVNVNTNKITSKITSAFTTVIIIIVAVIAVMSVVWVLRRIRNSGFDDVTTA